ncbi:diguanylate cyclase [Acidaminobacter sp. JC074]|uniref:histidine kinase N-terminal 7TM domain-containing diguanylate cyclase n=1 Tax=Acidaminobacter sp. JC074 TaxID=2530199 RepID=UPI001F0DCAF9|nr:diguanylate cyclase [Acidaminobacter sp. JC074]MCH4890849.1 diguanylate cyclase [Acidaminobacter sp. JC074]
MTFSYAYISVTIISLILILGILGITFTRRDKEGVKAFRLVITFMFIASLCALFERSSTTYETMHFWRNISQIGFFLLPASSYNFVMAYTREENKLFKSLRLINFIFAITCVLLIFTNGFHGIMRSAVYLGESSAGYTVLKVDQTLIGKICVSINTLMNVIALIKLWIFMRTTSKSSRMQVRLVLIGFFIPVVFTYTKSAIFSVLNIEVPAAFSFLLGIAIVMFGMYRYDFMSISPIARDWVIDEIKSGMVFCKRDGTVVDVNAYIREQFAATYEGVESYIKEHSTWYESIIKGGDHQLEIQTENKTYAIKVHDLTKSNKSLGSVSLIDDVTKERLHQELLMQRAERDSMTEVLNRAFFEKKIKAYIDACEVDDEESAMIIFDIDYFKQINDTYGHQIGDDVIKKVVDVINLSSRSGDLVGRLGGDEFGMFLKNTKVEYVNQIVERIQETLDSYKFKYNGSEFTQTLSIGVSIRETKQMTFDLVYNESDQALYKAKQAGRNTVRYFHIING